MGYNTGEGVNTAEHGLKHRRSADFAQIPAILYKFTLNPPNSGDFIKNYITLPKFR
jgi:hypothetical protein